MQKPENDLTDPGNWSDMEKMAEQQRSFFSSQVVLLAENHNENTEFRSTERAVRHLTSSISRHILRIVMDVVLYLSTNCLSFRESHETPSEFITQYPQPSQRNFLNLISLFAKHNSILKFQLEDLKKGQVSYLSKTI